MPQLLVTSSANSSFRMSIEITDIKSSIGSDPSNTIVLDDQIVAPFHAIIICQGNSFFIKAQSGAEIERDGQRCKSFTLFHGDIFSIGHFQLRFDLLRGLLGPVPMHVKHSDQSLLEASYQLFEHYSHQLLCGESNEVIVQHILDTILEITDASTGCYFGITNEQNVEFVGAAQTDKGCNNVRSYSASVVNTVLASRQLCVVPDAMADPSYQHSPSIMDLSLRSILCVPVFNARKIVGIIYLTHDTAVDKFTAKHIDLVRTVGQQLGLLLSHASVFQSLQDSEERHRLLIEMLPEAIVVCTNGIVEFINQAGLSLFGANNPTDIIEQPCTQFFLKENLHHQLQPISCAHINPAEKFMVADAKLQRIDGKIIEIELSGTPITYNGQQSYQLICRDMTEKRRLLDERMRMERLVTMGTVAASVAHEMNNPLTYIRMNLEYALEEIAHRIGESTDRSMLELHSALQSAVKGSEQLRQVVSTVRQYACQDNTQMSRIDINVPIQFAIDVTRAEISSHATFQSNLEPDLLVYGNQARLSQVFINLLINAAQAMAGNREQNTIELISYSKGDNIVVEVHDSGMGIAPDMIDEIFKPFVTSKSTHEGCGLGLAISQSVLEAMRGRLEVTSQVGKGSCFRVILPEARALEHTVDARLYNSRGLNFLSSDSEPISV